MADLAHAAENDNDLHGDTNAMNWAQRFADKFTVERRRLGGQGSTGDVTGLMLTWFASAIETGKAASFRPPADGDRFLPVYDAVFGQELSEAVHQAMGAASACWDNLEGAGEFDSDTACRIATELIGVIVQFARTYPHPGEPGYDPAVHGVEADIHA